MTSHSHLLCQLTHMVSQHQCFLSSTIASYGRQRFKLRLYSKRTFGFALSFCRWKAHLCPKPGTLHHVVRDSSDDEVWSQQLKFQCSGAEAVVCVEGAAFGLFCVSFLHHKPLKELLVIPYIGVLNLIKSQMCCMGVSKTSTVHCL